MCEAIGTGSSGTSFAAKLSMPPSPESSTPEADDREPDDPKIQDRERSAKDDDEYTEPDPVSRRTDDDDDDDDDDDVTDDVDDDLQGDGPDV